MTSNCWTWSRPYVGLTHMRPNKVFQCTVTDHGDSAWVQIYNIRTHETIDQCDFKKSEWGDSYLDQAKAWAESHFFSAQRPPTPINAQIIAGPDHTATVQMLRSGQRVVVATIGQYGSLHQTIQIEAPLEIGEAISLLEFILWTQSNQEEQENG